MGLGTDNLILVKTDETGRMIPTELEREIRKAIEAGQTPFFVGATAGTTVLGSFDPIEELADICSQHGLWLHVDVGTLSLGLCFINVFSSDSISGLLGRWSFGVSKVSISHERHWKVKLIVNSETIDWKLKFLSKQGRFGGLECAQNALRSTDLCDFLGQTQSMKPLSSQWNKTFTHLNEPRAYWRNATQPMRATCSNRTSSTTWATIQ